jgi:hypothetical protein
MVMAHKAVPASSVTLLGKVGQAVLAARKPVLGSSAAQRSSRAARSIRAVVARLR